jgi:hypothetical protein
MRSLLLFIIVLLAACSEAKKEPFKEERVKTATSFVQLIASYSADNVAEQFESAKKLMSEAAAASFNEKRLKPELASIQSSGRSQTFTLAEDGIDYQTLDNEVSTVAILGHRERVVSDKKSKPIELAYFISFAGENKRTATEITQVEIQVSGGQIQAIAEEKLLERFNEASGAAKTERKKFVEAVKMVSEDLKAHEQKVEKDFNRLSTSLDKLGGTVRKLKDQAVAMRKKKSLSPTQAPKPETLETVETPNHSEPTSNDKTQDASEERSSSSKSNSIDSDHSF